LQRQYLIGRTTCTARKKISVVTIPIKNIPLHTLMVAPRQLPYHAGFSYFELDKSGAAWADVAATGAVALHVSGTFPDLNMQLWAIRG
ncbi:type VI secretion system baseplate subunit TssK, partial [Salmonella enterica subsp. enterica serovar Meleagridis]|nr:type VI secretion system baseplate subunit TssK [Salmonella enterica subsp. enterica serovar Meleagridis]